MKGYKVDRVLPFTGMGMTMYQAELTGPDGESRILRINPWGNVKPFGGPQAREIYLTLATGLNGTPMPAYAAALDGQQIWALVYYLESLVPEAHRLSPREMLGEEQRGWMILRMQGMMGHGMMQGR